MFTRHWYKTAGEGWERLQVRTKKALWLASVAMLACMDSRNRSANSEQPACPAVGDNAASCECRVGGTFDWLEHLFNIGEGTLKPR